MDPVFHWILRLGLAALFATAAAHKASDPRGFRATLAGYRVLPPALLPAAVPLLVALEAGLALSLVLPGTTAWAALGAAGLLLVYSAAIGANLARGRIEIDCGCFGPGAGTRLSTGLLLRNGLLVLASALAALPASHRGLTPIDVLSVGGGLCVVSLLFHATNRLATRAPASHRLGSST